MRARRLIAVVAAAVVASACSGESPDPPPASRATPTPTPTPPPVCAFTGEEPHEPSLAARPAVAVKVENSPQARPQSGLEHADVVVEEVVEGGITRFMAIYQCGSSKQVGPVRSARFDDPRILAPFGRVLVYSGGNQIVENEVRRAGIVRINEITARPPALYREPPGTITVHNLFASIPEVRKLTRVRRTKAPTGPLFDYGEPPAGGRKARKVALEFGPTSTVEYRWRAGSWARFEDGAPFGTAAGGAIEVPNVLVLEVAVEPARGLVDVAGNQSPAIKLHGRGRMLLFRGGRVVKGKWSAKRAGDGWTLTTRSGEPVTLAPGQTWIELVPDPEGQFKGSISFR